MSERPDQIQNQKEDMPEGYVLNKGLPTFVGDTEIRRLRAVIREKNRAIEAFKKYDEERKAYYAKVVADDARVKEENQSMKEFVDSFMEELKAVYADGEISQSDYEQMTKLFANWYTYKTHSALYKGKLKSARSSIHDLQEDLDCLERAMTGIGDFRTATQIADRFVLVRQHLDNLLSKLMS